MNKHRMRAFNAMLPVRPMVAWVLLLVICLHGRLPAEEMQVWRHTTRLGDYVVTPLPLCEGVVQLTDSGLHGVQVISKWVYLEH